MTLKFLDMSIIIFKLLCCIAAFFMVGFWIFKFHENEDVSAIEYISYESHSNIIYPEMTICINHPFLYDNLSLDSGVNVSTMEYYLYILGKRSFREEYRHISYSNVTLNILEYVQDVNLFMRNDTFENRKRCEGIETCPYVSFKNNFNGFIKNRITRCSGFHVNLTSSGNVEALSVGFKPELSNILNQFSKNNLAQTFILLNYPGQILHCSEVGRPIWNNPNSSLGMYAITVSSNEILRRRHKTESPCFSDWMNFDDRVLKKHHDRVGCSPPYQNSEKPLCTSKEQIADSRYDYIRMASRYYPVPCEGMSNIIFSFDKFGDAAESNIPSSPSLFITYPKTTRLVTQFKSVDLHALIGNIGGYIGLFLGK